MSTDDFSKQQYVALRAEISESKSRVFWLLLIGIALVFAAGYVAAEHPTAFANAAIPFLLLAVMLSFIAEESNISRAGRYLREVVEPNIKEMTCWERWLETQTQFRMVDRSFVVGFSVLLLSFFVITASLSVRQMDDTGQRLELIVAAATAYVLGGVCIVYVLVRHWTASVKPSDEPRTSEADDAASDPT